ncbi:MAG: hypothetical protein SOI66_09060 [Bifidobacterium sp.]|jgi:hypothetical protein
MKDNGIPEARQRELQRLLDKAHKNYQDNLDNLRDAATDEMETVLQRHPLDVRELVEEYARDSSQLANDYYDDIRSLWSEYGIRDMPEFDHFDLIDPDRTLWQVQRGFNDSDYAGLTYQEVQAGKSRAGKTIADLWPSFDDLDDAQQFIADMISAGSRLTMQRNLRIDPTHPRWARVPRGAVTCAFCLMLASRGFVYLSDESAGLHNAFHTHCDCDIVPSWGRQTLIGYDQSQYADMWHRANSDGGDYRKSLERLRRLFPQQIKDGVDTDS